MADRNRQMLCECWGCGYKLRASRKWLDVATPNCPNPNCDYHGQPMSRDDDVRDDARVNAELERQADHDRRSDAYHRLPRPARWRCPDCSRFRPVEDAGADCDACKHCGSMSPAVKRRKAPEPAPF